MYVKKRLGVIGAEIDGLDLEKNDDAMYAQIDSLLMEHQVLFFRDQDISHESHKRMATRFGVVKPHPAYQTVEDFPEITILESTAEAPSKIECWHSDMTYSENPPLGTILRSRIVPEIGGDTMWSSMTAAYEGLSANMKQMLGSLYAVHDFTHGFKETLSTAEGRERLKEAIIDNPPVQHPVINLHPVTNKPCIYVNELFTTRILGIPKLESESILNFLFKHIQTPEYTCRFNWSPNCVVLWDNRCTQHKPINDYFPAHRKLERITVESSN